MVYFREEEAPQNAEGVKHKCPGASVVQVYLVGVLDLESIFVDECSKKHQQIIKQEKEVKHQLDILSSFHDFQGQTVAHNERDKDCIVD